MIFSVDLTILLFILVFVIQVESKPSGKGPRKRGAQFFTLVFVELFHQLLQWWAKLCEGRDFDLVHVGQGFEDAGPGRFGVFLDELVQINS